MTTKASKKKRSSKKKTSKRTTKKTGGSSATRKKASKKKTSTKRSTTSTRKKAPTRKKASKKTSTRKKAPTRKKAATRSAPPSMPKGMPEPVLEVQGVSVQTHDGKKPKNSARCFLRLNQIKVEKGFNPRIGGLGDTDALEASIRAEGVLQNLVVRPSGDGKTFKLVAGERRYHVLKKLGGKHVEAVPVLIRMDLEKDNDRAVAVAVAESSPDGRTNLSPIEVGKVVERLTKKKWAPAKIAKETGLHLRKVQRILQVMETPQDVQERVHSGDWSERAAIEFHRLPDEVKESVKSKVGRSTTQAEIRKYRREAEREQAKQAAAKGEAPKKTKRGTPPTTKAPAWKPAREKQGLIRELAYELSQFEGSEVGQEDYHEIRGALAAFLCDRGDIESPILMSINVDNEDDPAAAKKANAYFDSIVEAEAALYEPDEAESE